MNVCNGTISVETILEWSNPRHPSDPITLHNIISQRKTACNVPRRRAGREDAATQKASLQRPLAVNAPSTKTRSLTDRVQSWNDRSLLIERL